jgi:hypothetical protein
MEKVPKDGKTKEKGFLFPAYFEAMSGKMSHEITILRNRCLFSGLCVFVVFTACLQEF